MSAINLNRRDYYVTGQTVWDDGRVREFDTFLADPVVCPQVHRYGPEISPEQEAAQIPSEKRFWSLRHPAGMPQPVGYTITYLTCTKLTAEDHEVEDARAEIHAAEQLAKMDQI